jgi:tRNA(Ile)-lysidine synthase
MAGSHERRPLGVSLEERITCVFRELGVDDGAPVGVACSGGSDSVALLSLAAATRNDVAVLHVDHGLRDDSAADAAFVEGLAERLGVPARVDRVEIDARSSIEAASRDARYRALTSMADDLGLAHVATAHTLDDQAETVLLRSMRGGSLDCIAPQRGRFVRPLLGVRRAELLEWLTSHGIEWRDDPSNADLRFERNWVRRVLLPQMRERRAGVELALARVADHSRQDNEALDAYASDVFGDARIDDIGVLLPPLSDVPPAVRTRVVRHGGRALGVDLSDDDVAAVLASSHARVRGVEVARIGGGIALISGDRGAPPAIGLPASGGVEDAHRGIRVRTGPGASPAWPWRVVLEPGPAEIRARRPGDRVTTSSGSRKVQDVLVDSKVPRPLRDLVGIVARGPDSDGRALAVVGRTSTGRVASSGAGTSGMVVDVEPIATSSWARELLWNR